MGRGSRGEVEPAERAPTFFLLHTPAEPAAVTRLAEGEAHHAFRVLRLSDGAVVPATDGRGARYRVRIHREGSSAVAEVLSREKEHPAVPSLEVGVGFGRRERFLWCVEKLTELEVARLVPLLSETVQGRKSLAGAAGERVVDKARARAAAALKQSKGAYLPEVTSASPLESWSRQPFEGVSLVLAFPERGVRPLLDVLAEPRGVGGRRPERDDRADRGAAGEDLGVNRVAAVRLAVGPEGGFLADEERWLVDAGFTRAHLGARRLRFETAAVAAVAQVRALTAQSAAEP